MRRDAAIWLVLAATYTLAGKLGLALAFVHPSATAVWPPTGIALAAVLILGPRAWPGIFLGAVLTNETTAGARLTTLLIAGGNTFEALLGGYLVNRFAGGRSAFDRGRNIFRFVLSAGTLSTAVSATVGVTTLSLFGFSQWAAYWPTWLTWWLGDVSGAIVVTPAILFWYRNPRIRWSRAEWVELFGLALLLVAIGWTVFGLVEYPLGFLCIPICVWAACRFGQREAATATCALSLIAIWGTVQGVGTFARDSPNEGLLLVQSFMAVVSIVSLTVSSAVSGRYIAEGQLRQANTELERNVQSRTRALAASEARLAEAQQLAHVGSWEWNVADNTEWWSDELYRICGVELHTVAPTYGKFLNLLPSSDRDAVMEIVGRALQDHQPFQFEHRIIRPDGSTRTVHSHGRVVTNETGQVVRVMGTTQDITERKAVEEVVNRSERRLKTIIDAEPACVKLVSSGGILLEMNHAGLAMLGATDALQLIGRPIIEVVHPDDRARFLETHRRASNGSSGRLEFRIVRLDGGERWVDSHLVPFDSSVEGAEHQRTVLSVTSDVTDRKHLEDQLRQSQKMEAIGLLAGGIAHDFNNLLTAIGGYVDLVLRSLDDGDARREDLQEVAKAAHRAAALTRQLLAFSRRQILQPTVLDVNAMMADLRNLLRRTMPENIDLQLELGPSLNPVRADGGQLEQVVLNLAINAGDAMPQGGRLRIATDNVEIDDAWARRHQPMPAGRYVRLTVIDTGMGMAPEIQTRIFEPFFSTKERGKGTGLGLATVYGIVKQSSGFIWVSSEVGRGTTFEVYLPVVDEAVAPILQAAAVADISGSQTILLAEDDPTVRRLARDVLANQGYTVLDARDGDEALAVARQYPGAIHLLIADVVMPGLSGRDLASRLTDERPDLRVLYTSGYAENMMTRAGFETGLALLAKPFLPEDLLRNVDAMLGR